MTTINLRSLVQKLNPICQQSLEMAISKCMSRSHFSVELPHWLLALIEVKEGDFAYLLPHYQISHAQLQTEIHAQLEPLKTGNDQSPVLSQWMVDWMREAWLLSSLEAGQQQIRSAYLLYALIHSQPLNQMAFSLFPQLKKIKAADLQLNLESLIKGSCESSQVDNQPIEDVKTSVTDAQTPSLNQFTIDLNEQAKKGKIDEVIGRDDEIRQMIDILMRRRQNNPILTGEPGVGKTAVVEGLALKIAKGDVPPALKNVRIHTLDLGLLQAGAGIKGEFENRLKKVIHEVKNAPHPIILFIDEAHTMVGAGAQSGQNDAANLLKPALARGELRTIAATTWAEYKKYFEQDAALARRFQVVKIEEPDENTAIQMVRGLVTPMEAHHEIQILDEAVMAAVQLSHRYLSERQLPDKAISVLDTACARASMRLDTVPTSIEKIQKQIECIKTEIELLTREELLGHHHPKQLKQLATREKALLQEHQTLDTRFKKEKILIEKISSVKAQLTTSEKNEKLTSDLQKLTQELRKLQGENPFLQDCVTAQSIAEVISAWTGIPLGRMKSGETESVLNLQQKMEERVIGQSEAIKTISERIYTAKAGLTDPRKPMGVFLFVGPSGVGKTETAHALAEQLYGGEQNLTVINLSEFKEEHKVSLLLGSPPGYVGYGEGGVLTEAVRRKPYSLLLLDEVEKAHPGVHDIFYQIFDKGTIKDGQGRDIDFKNTLIVLTSNVGSEIIQKFSSEPEAMPDREGFVRMLKPELSKHFKTAFLGRVMVVPYVSISDDTLKKIVMIQLEKIKQRVLENQQIVLTFSDEVIAFILSQSIHSDMGVRSVEQFISRQLLPELSMRCLIQTIEKKKAKKMMIKMDKDNERLMVAS